MSARARSLGCGSVSPARGSRFGWPYGITPEVVFFRGAVGPIGVKTTTVEGGDGAGSSAIERGFGGGGCDGSKGTERASHDFNFFLASLRGLVSVER